MISADRFLGRKAKPCGRCGSIKHYVNPMGGTSCVQCHPPKTESIRLDCVSGVWQLPATSPAPAAGGEPDAVGVNPRQAAYLAAIHDEMTRPGGTLDRMDSAGHCFAFVSTSAQIAVKMRQSSQAPQERPGLAGETVESMTFWNGDARRSFPAGTPCEIFPGNSVPRNDPDSAAIIFSLKSRKDARSFSVIRLDGRLRIVAEKLARPLS